MKILLYKDNLSTGRGADRAVVALAEAVAKHHTVVLITKSEHKISVGAIVQVVRCSGLYDLKTTINAVHPDVVVSAGTNETRDLAVLYPDTFPWPVVHQFHVYPPTAFKWKHFVRNWKTRRAIRRVAAVQVLLPSYVASVKKWIGDNCRIVVIGNAVNVSRPPIPSHAHKQSQDEHAGTSGCKTGRWCGMYPHIVYPAAINKDKRQELLIRAFALMIHRNVVLSLYGSGNPKFIVRLKRLAVKLGVAERIRFKGFCNDSTAIYADADLVAFPSRVEGFGMVITESAAFGKHVVGCTDCYASAELVPRFGGILSEATPKALAQALDGGLDINHDGNAAVIQIEDALDEFSPANIYGRWEQLFASLVCGC